MRKIYMLYIVSALCNIWIVLFYLGFSAGFANYFPIAALLGTVLLFTVAAPLINYFPKQGLITGFIGMLLMFPYNVMFISGLLYGHNEKWNWVLLLIMLPSISTMVSAYFTFRILIAERYTPEVRANKTIKFILAGTPILLFVIYVFSFAKYWNWGMFKL